MALHEDDGAINPCGVRVTGSTDWEEVVQCRECLIPCVENGSRAGVNDWLKGGTACGRGQRPECEGSS